MARILKPANESLARMALSAYESHHRQLRRFLLRRSPKGQDTSDLLQEVYLRLLSIESSALVRNPKAYVYGIAAHVAHESHKRLRMERVDYTSQLPENSVYDQPASRRDDLAEELNVERQMEAVLASLPPNHLNVLILHRRDGLSVDEISQRLGLSRHTVKKYIVLALTAVRNKWQQQDEA